MMQPRRLRLLAIEAVGNRIEIITADAPQNARKPAGDLCRRAFNCHADFTIDGAEERTIFAAPPFVGGSRLERHRTAVAEDDVEAPYVVDGLAVDDRVRTRRVIADHAAQVGPTRGSD